MILVPKQRNSLYFSLLAGNFTGEELVRDCVLRQTVWVGEKFGCIALKIAGNSRNSSNLALKPDRRRCPAVLCRRAFAPFSLKDKRGVRFLRLRWTNAMRSRIDDSRE